DDDTRSSISDSSSSILPLVKTLEMRESERALAEWPVYAARQQIIEEVRKNYMLAIHTIPYAMDAFQVPQYMAETFGGITLCLHTDAMTSAYFSERIAF